MMGDTTTQNLINGNGNTLFGAEVFASASGGQNNTAAGSFAMHSPGVNALNNTAIGYNALINNMGNNNTAVGALAGSSNLSGNNNIFLANTSPSSTVSNTIYIRSITGGQTGQCYFGGIYGVAQTGPTLQVTINASGQLGTGALPSSIKYKENVSYIEDDSRVLSLEPVSYSLKKDPTSKLKYGFIAEQAVSHIPEIGIYQDGELYSMEADQVLPLLLKQIQSQQRRLESQRKEILALMK